MRPQGGPPEAGRGPRPPRAKRGPAGACGRQKPAEGGGRKQEGSPDGGGLQGDAGGGRRPFRRSRNRRAEPAETVRRTVWPAAGSRAGQRCDKEKRGRYHAAGAVA